MISPVVSMKKRSILQKSYMEKTILFHYFRSHARR